MGNSLLDNVKKIQRIIVPDKNAFDKYIKIKDAVRRHGKNKLILSILGPTATVLAYDLAKEGYWILDIGQLDTEYSWFLHGVKKRCALKYKMVSEAFSYETVETDMENEYIRLYLDEIVERIL